MIGESTVKLTIALKDSGLDDEELDRLTQNLLQEIKDLDELEQVNRVAVAETPQGAKSLGSFLLGMLQVEVSVANIKKLLGFVGDSLGNKPIEFEVEANGKKLKLKAYSQQELQAGQQFVSST
ncbi:hypothetical protein [Brasilonema bromeliae]|uniref:Sugar ABC transporter permease n=1 Tax=Brasilonema bromeliae SPC951 TaxID=385972 RepID=A0ABX1PCN3_9CYAN|nr:hypothetical protein [Brasilonema bromeliae]NMG21245.1 hypothetical protein [Brasilonema bromeliae SPC951]